MNVKFSFDKRKLFHMSAARAGPPSLPAMPLMSSLKPDGVNENKTKVTVFLLKVEITEHRHAGKCLHCYKKLVVTPCMRRKSQFHSCIEGNISILFYHR